MTTPDSPSPGAAIDALNRMEKEASDALARINEQIEPLEKERRLWQDRLRVLKEMRNLYSAPTLQRDVADNGVDLGARMGEHTIYIQTKRSVREDVQSHVRELIAEANGRLHINDIYGQFQARGWNVPGAGKASNISAHLTNAEGIYSPARGYYALGQAAPKKATKSTGRKTTRRRTTRNESSPSDEKTGTS